MLIVVRRMCCNRSLYYFSVLLLITATFMRPIDVFADAVSVHEASAPSYISYNNRNINDDKDSSAADSRNEYNNKEKKETGWSDIEHVIDANNNTMVDYKNLFGLHIGKVYNPNFVDNVDWFLNDSNYEDHIDYYLIPYNYTWRFYTDLSAPWYGCEAQSKAMLVTAKKYNQTGDLKYLEFSKKVFNGLRSPILNHEGWLLGVAIENKNAKILNSQLFCVANVMNYYKYTGDKRALELFNKGVNVVEKNINSLSKDCGTYYSLSKDNLVSYQKHPEYIQMLERLYLMSGSNALKNTLNDWKHHYQFPCYS